MQRPTKQQQQIQQQQGELEMGLQQELAPQ
jgi:hypothetical protein